MIFLIDYDRLTGVLASIRGFDQSERREAEQARLDLELRHLNQNLTREVVLLEARSRTDLERSHRRYFEKLQQLTNGPNSVFADAI